MAYVALTSLKTTIELHFLQPIPRVPLHLHDDQALIKSFYENLSSLQDFLEEKSSVGGAAIKYFGTLVRDFALKVEDDIEIQLSNFVVAKAKDDAVHQEATSQQLCQILQQAQENTADVVEIINCGGEYERQNGDLTYLKRIMDHHMKSIQSNGRSMGYDQIQTLFKSLIESLSSLRQLFLHIRAPSIKDSETEIGDLVEDEIKIHLSSFVLAQDTVDEDEASSELCQILKQAEEKRVELEERLKTYECCDDLTDLLRAVRLLQPTIWLSDDVITAIGSLEKTLFALQKFLHKSNFGAAEITDFVLKAKKDIRKQFIRNLCVANKEHLEELFQTLHQATENADKVLSTIRNTARNEANHTQSEFEFSRCYPKLEEGRMIGHQNDVSMIKDRLFSQFDGVKVIPIIGMLGIGKTTLARKILEDQEVALHFQVRGWVTVTQNYKETKVLRDLLQSISPNHEIKKEVPLWEQVCECLNEKRCLIVLDDIWSNHLWDRLEDLFCESAVNGSCILLTTRFYGVANFACKIKGTYHVMNLLDRNESWDLFYTIFPLQRYRAPSFGKFRSDLFHVVEICEGLPVSIFVVAKRLSECKNNIQHELKKIEKEIELLGILDYNALILMYNELPEYLKVCFLYLGVFPKRSEIQVETILRLWIAEGFVKPSKNEELETIAYCYLKDLIDSSLVLICKQTFDGKIKTCRVHNVMHNICFREGQKEGILCAVNTQQLPTSSLNAFANSCRWLSLCKHRFDYYVLFSSNNPRSIFFFQENTEIFVSLKLLRVLAFVQSSFLQRLPMQQLGDLIFLRYLSVTQWFEGLSDVVSTNVNLQTLIISHNGADMCLPSKVLESPQLRHVEVSYALSVDPPNEVKEALQTLYWLSLDHCTEEVFSRIPNVKKLGIICGSKPSPKAIEPANLKNLECLYNLETLMIAFRKGSPSGLRELRYCLPLYINIRELKLKRTCLPWSEINLLGILPNLEALELKEVSDYPNWKPTCTVGHFYKLQFLYLEAENLESWEVDGENQFRCLKHLILKRCTKLKAIPTGFEYVNTLESIELLNCPHLVKESAQEISDNREIYGSKPIIIRHGLPLFSHSMSFFEL
ncbi:PREDICTED: putative disease resistance RPP13-like protein 3 [Ipomoea nil]|uniref:putative disease resistance RPP13-like protein 3 n=1 Tax=Ipomoea nil TaxID=35883 RepID=UPI00090087C7|nr:PREDICTED: putative disease resistance RPP13-like protein 3 [Ipomoea nil]